MYLRLLFPLFLFIALPAAPVQAQVPRPADVLGFEPGADYELADYDQLLDYYRQLDAASDRVSLVEIGRSVQGRPLVLLFVSSAENLRDLDRWRRYSAGLAQARVPEDSARVLARTGKAVVWVDGGLHATEVAGAQMGPVLAYRVATEETAEMQRIRDEVILLLMPVMNPDGLDLVAHWYRSHRGTPFETTTPPRLYHAIAGHDNNRDWFMHNLPETRAVAQVLYETWFPQVVLNHHQSAPDGARIFVPPFADPVNPNIHPGVTTAVNMAGSAMANRFAHEGKPGVVSGVAYSMWWNGGMRTVPYFHNMIGLLTEVAHASPTPRFTHADALSRTVQGFETDGTHVHYPDPWQGGLERLSDAVDYMVTASIAVLDLAAGLREAWLFNQYRMGRDAIVRGREQAPFAYVIPATQWDPGEARELVDVLLRGGLEVHQALDPFEADGRTYAAGSYVLFAAQAFRPYLMDLMEPQRYPDRRRYPGGPPETPYDLTGWTLPLQMGVAVHRMDTPFASRTQRITSAGDVGGVSGAHTYGFALSPRSNRSYDLANRLLSAGETVFRAASSFIAGGRHWPAGTLVVAARESTAARVASLADSVGVEVHGLAEAPRAALHRVDKPRVAVYQSWVANVDAGWTQWLLDTYGFDADTLRDADVNGRTLSAYDAVILPSQDATWLLRGHAPGTMPEPFVGGIGDDGARALREYVEAGGTLVAFDAATAFVIEQFGLPVRNVVERVRSERFFVPGSLLRVAVDTLHPYAAGMPDTFAVVFAQSRAFAPVGDRGDAAPTTTVYESVARYVERDVLASGWARGAETYLGGRDALVRVRYGRGEVVLFGFRPQFRGQSRGTYKLIFNPIFGAATADEPVPDLPAAVPLE